MVVLASSGQAEGHVVAIDPIRAIVVALAEPGQLTPVAHCYTSKFRKLREDLANHEVLKTGALDSNLSVASLHIVGEAGEMATSADKIVMLPGELDRVLIIAISPARDLRDGHLVSDSTLTCHVVEVAPPSGRFLVGTYIIFRS